MPLVDLAKRMGVDERDASRLENIVTRHERQINEFTPSPATRWPGIGQSMQPMHGKADSPFHESGMRTETTFKRLDREAEDRITFPMQASLILSRCYRRSNRSSLHGTLSRGRHHAG